MLRWVRGLCLLVCLCVPSLAGAQAALMPDALQQFFDANGNPLASGTLTFYTAGTTTPQAVPVPPTAVSLPKTSPVQAAPPADLVIPPAPPLTPEQALKTFKLPPGFRIEIVAADPLIETPIAMQWDADGRLWVVEMPSYMNTPTAEGELNPINRVSVLEDTDGDGRMDKKTVFLDKLVMPRALCLAYGGVLVCEPPVLNFYPIEPGLKPGKPVLVDKNYAPNGIKNPEHTGNSPTWLMNNWIVSANHTLRFRRVDNEWKRSATTSRGQWGLTMDDWGRPYYNSNSDQLRTDYVPSEYYFRNPLFRTTAGLMQQPMKDQTVYPARVNPGVNRGYQEKTLKPDGRLDKYTATCGPGIYRGDQFPAEFLGNAFIPEPSANMVRRMVLTEKNGELTGTNPYKEAEFLTSTDELFRPVNAYTGPDGCLYLVDMYHGILQHRVFLTSYLRKQAEDRGLDKVIKHGRIYRIVHDGKKPGPKPQLAAAAPGLRPRPPVAARLDQPAVDRRGAGQPADSRAGRVRSPDRRGGAGSAVRARRRRADRRARPRAAVRA